MLPIPMKLVVTQTGDRYILKSIHNGIVARQLVPDIAITFGEVLSVSGISTKHGPDKKFKLDKVTIVDVERTEELLKELLAVDV